MELNKEGFLISFLLLHSMRVFAGFRKVKKEVGLAHLEHKKELRELQIFIPSFVYLAWAEKSVIEKPRK